MTPVEHFLKYFSIAPCTTSAQKELSYNIRYQVYCEEFGYLKHIRGSPKIETDEYDDQSMHCLLIHKASQRAIGCARLIVADSRYPERPFPFEKYCSPAIDKNLFDPDEFLPGQIAEFSRIAVLKEFRRLGKAGTNPNLRQECISNDHRVTNFPVIPVSLFLACVSMLISSNADWGFAMMEPRLERLLRRYGLILESVGEPIDYHGWRSPYIYHRSAFSRHIKHGMGELFFEVNRALTKVDKTDKKHKENELEFCLEEA